MAQQQRLARDTRNQVLGGVCSGIANQFGWDPTVVRVLAALSILVFAGTPILVYIILWAVIPTDVSLYSQTTWQQAPGYQADPNQTYQQGYQQGYEQGYQQANPAGPAPQQWNGQEPQPQQ